MEITWQRVLPVVISIIIIIGVAILRQYSKMLAAVLVTMPLNVTMGLLIIFSGSESDPTAARLEFAQNLLVNIFPTVFFLIVVFIVVRAGWSLLPSLIAGYSVWALSFLLLLGLRRLIGF